MRAYSQYRNAIKAGEITAKVSFDSYIASEPSCLEQGKYAEQLALYQRVFDKEQLLVLVYEDSKHNPLSFIQSIYRHIGVDDTFVPPSLNVSINVARTPKAVGVDKGMHNLAEWLRLHGLDRLVYFIRRTGLPELVRKFNTTVEPAVEVKPDFERYKNYFSNDMAKLSEMLGRDIKQIWKL